MQIIRGFLYFENISYDDMIKSLASVPFNEIKIFPFRFLKKRDGLIEMPGVLFFFLLQNPIGVTLEEEETDSIWESQWLGEHRNDQTQNVLCFNRLRTRK